MQAPTSNGCQERRSLPVVVGRQNAAKCIWSAMVASFTSAGVPLKIFRNPEVRKWIEANVKTGDTLPSETTLRKLLTQEEARISKKRRKCVATKASLRRGVSTSQLICLKSDNAKYMLTAGKTLKGLSSRMIHSTCWSHMLHLAPSRREELFRCLEAKGYRRKLPPTPVITRWCTWLEQIFFTISTLMPNGMASRN
ncbi:hypothetical protein Ocin01_18795 [Orchesella cincta]|uniref:Uncharacterized protein n=1 Tax=Orchesella cincta TaxID=48709 RepID=A0A1D2M4H9_ORCCI|nr:hypothetical protein Ocin01_18795 [Orchesella cincta]